MKQACKKNGIAVEFKFMSEADPSTRKMHSALVGQYHGLRPQAKVSDLVKTPPIKDLDLYMAGPPCPSYSTLVQGAGGEDARGTVLYHVCHYIKSNKPKAFVIENVA